MLTLPFRLALPVLAVALFACHSARAQTPEPPAPAAAVSPLRFPYPPTYGLGLPFLNDNDQSVRSRGMGGVGMAVPEPNFINDFNPAQLAYLPNLVLDIDLTYGPRPATVLAGGKAATYFNGQKLRIPTFRVAYPVISGLLVLAAAYHPKRLYEFSASGEQTVPRTDSLNGQPITTPDLLVRQVTGSSAVQQASLAAGFTLTRWLSGGLSGAYSWGTFGAASRAARFGLNPAGVPDTLAAGQWTDAGKLTILRFTGALGQRINLSQTLTLRSGLSATYTRLIAKGAPSGAARDLTQSQNTLARATPRVPLLLRGGLAVSDELHWRVGADAAWQRWSQYRSWGGAEPGQPKLPDLLQLAVGAEYSPGGNTAATYLQRITYRLGARYGRLPREEAPKPLTEMMGTAGVSLPVGSAFEARHSSINLALAVGRQAAPAYAATDGLFGGTPSAGKLVFELGLGFTYNTKLYGKIGRGNCPIPSCHVRKKHMHDGAEYTGQPWYKKQNPRIGENLPERKPDTRPSKRPQREKY